MFTNPKLIAPFQMALMVTGYRISSGVRACEIGQSGRRASRDAPRAMQTEPENLKP
jgi:hypothetical protein